jgi:Zn finger protein HypA/HybF involved in hydrogenase expression
MEAVMKSKLDFPFMDVVQGAQDAMMAGATIYQKFTCFHCGSRQTMSEPNKMFIHGICEECGKETNIKLRGCNYLVHFGEGSL